MKIKYILLIIVATLFFSCNQSDVGIFYGLEKEVKIKDNSLSNNLTIGSMAKTDSGELYIAAGRVYTKTSGSSEDWRKVSIPSGYDLSTSLASLGNDVYTVFFDTDTAEKALYKMQNGGSWTEVTDPIFDGSIESVKSAGSYILVSTSIKDSNEGKLYYSNGGAFTEVADIPMTGSVFHVIYDLSDYWVSNYNKLYQGDLTTTMADAPLTLDSASEIRGLSLSSGSYIYLSCWDRDDSRGYIMVTDGIAETIEDTGEKEIYNLYGLKTFTTDGYEFLLCGTGGRGYRQISSPSLTNLDLKTPKNDVLSENYTSAIDLQNCVVLDFFIDGGDDGDLYALTATTGLWKNSLSGGTRVWSIE